ncbi:hypothetical protein [Amaricoccus sp.]|uniref:hypothetical protein n=1 Tax=Amaricoccus sp. TaxID=1872485 RepID=UPI001B661C1B|nr:hypothetical protein [Amaricoccus sp.]MBP7242555.1 hypothetical protein [Amaricoccus sp.]
MLFPNHPPINPVGRLPLRRRERFSTPWLVAILSLVIASAFVVDVGVPARIDPAAQQVAGTP